MRSSALFVGALLALTVALVALSTPRMLGDSGDYVVMALNLARGDRPSLSPADLQRAAVRYPGDVSAHLVIPEYRSIDGRQDLSHFWFYPLLAAPLVRAALAVGGDPIRGFTVLNLLLLAAAALVLATRQSKAVALFVAAGPILWWTDKAQTEVFTFSLLTIAVALLRDAPWWSAAALGAASTQNPPLAAAMLLAIGYGVVSIGWRDRRLWLGAAAGLAFAALHPIYYHLRLGQWSALRVGIDPHWPELREILTPAIDPNLGIFVYDLPLTLVLVAALVLVLSDPRRSPKRILHGERAVVLIVAVLFLFSFTQTTNVNSGGTPGPSRYGLWLIPLTLPLLATIPSGARWLHVMAGVSLVWCGALFAPQLPELYVSPSRVASTLWERWPGLDNPVAEVFGERAGGREPAPGPPIVAAGCRKALVEGTGSGSVTLPHCDLPNAIDVPLECQTPGVYCYANRSDASTWTFVRAPATPYWRVDMARLRTGAPVSRDAPLAAYTLPPEHPSDGLASLGSGWSYIERIPATGMAWRWMGDSAEVRLETPGADRVRIRIVARAFGRPRRLRLAIEGREIAQFTVAEDRREFETAPIALPSGLAVVSFESLDGSDSPGGGDPRRISVALFHFEIVRTDR